MTVSIGYISLNKTSYEQGEQVIINWANVNFIDGGIKLYNSNNILQKWCIETDFGSLIYDIPNDALTGECHAELIDGNNIIVDTVIFNIILLCPIPIVNIILQ